MNTPTPARPAHVPTLTEVIEPLSPAAAPVPDASFQAEVRVDAPAQLAPELPDLTDLPRNLMRTSTPNTGAESAWPAPAATPMPAPPHTGVVPSAQELLAARANLSGALRSARDGRWAPMPNVELPAQGADASHASHASPQGDTAQLDLPELAALLEPAPQAPVYTDLPTPAVQAATPAALPITEVTEVTEAQLAHRVLGVVQKQIDGMLDYRLREAITPLLQRHTDALVRDLRDELKQTMQDVINRAVAQEMAKVRQR